MRVRKSKRVETFFEHAHDEALRAMKKFPYPNPSLAALMEEVGELAQALLEKQEPYLIYAEAKQVAAVACRIAIEGDPQFTKQVAGRMVVL